MKKILKSNIILIILVALIFLAYLFYKTKDYYLLLMVLITSVCLPFFYRFERKKIYVEEIVLLAFIVTLAVVGRFVFVSLPGTPVTAIIIYGAAFLGNVSGFMIGALTALVSNLYLGHGPWTIFQMFAWGFIGLLSGFLRFLLFPKITKNDNVVTAPLITIRRENRNLLFLSIWGFLSGIIYYLILDIHQVFFIYKKFTLAGYLSVISIGFPFLIEHAITNPIFIIGLYKPLIYIFTRLREKYGIGKNIIISDKKWYNIKKDVSLTNHLR